MSKAKYTPRSDSKSEKVSAVKDKAIGAAAKAAVTIAPSTSVFEHVGTVSGLYEIQAAEIALKRSRREDVKEFARRMIYDHKDIASKLGSFLGGMDEPHSPPKDLDIPHKVLISDLEGASDEDFDTRYIAQQKAEHSAAITLLEKYSSLGELHHGNKGGLRNLAELALPTFRKHMDMVLDLEHAISSEKEASHEQA